jgi:hypothetical protein
MDSNESQQKEHAIVERIRSLRKRMTSSMNSPNGNNEWLQCPATHSGALGEDRKDRGRNQNAEGCSVILLLQKTSGESMAGPAAYLDGSRGSSREQQAGRLARR